MSPALLLNSCSFETMRLHADLCTVQLLWASWVQCTLQGQPQGGGNQSGATRLSLAPGPSGGAPGQAWKGSGTAQATGLHAHLCPHAARTGQLL